MATRFIMVLGTTALLTIHSAEAAIITIDASKDNTLYESSAGLLSNGKGNFLFAGGTNQGTGSSLRRALLAFDVADAVPAGATIDAVTLSMSMSKTRWPTPYTVNLHRATADWGEGTSNAPGQEGSGTNATAGDATWLHTFSPGSLWTTSGGDFVPTASASQSVGAIGVYSWDSTMMTVADVQSWLDAPTGNFGWVLVGDESVNSTTKRFDSRENTGNGPRLAITYSIPAPATITLLILGMPGLMRRTRLGS